jgi:nucleotide-binding universal stress UspA family protein
MFSDEYRFQKAIDDFYAARQKAGLQEVLARWTGKSTTLFSYEEVAEKLKLRGRSERGLQLIPLNSIVGSVGRYSDFTRTFLPRRDENRERWARVKTAMETGEGVPPIEVYKVGDVYFVIDGNHRVSIAQQMDLKNIEARVIEVRTDVPLSPDMQPDDLIVKAEYASFLDDTQIMNLHPNVDLSVTIPGQYEKLTEQICEQQCWLEQDENIEASFQQAVESWYDNTYIPLAEMIRDRGLLRWFPNRTITDLYIWISENRATVEKELGWEIQSEAAATDLILEHGTKSEPGAWRKARTMARYTDKLFADILVPLSGYRESWDALDQAILIAQREHAHLHGLYIVDSFDDLQSPDAKGVKERFDQTCLQAGVEGNLAIEVGDITQQICARAVLTDLIVLKIVNPPSAGISALRSSFRTIIQKSSRPLITVPGTASRFEHALLAYDGSDRAREALFVATYFAEMWKTRLTVFTAREGTRVGAEAQEYARRYLEFHEVPADYILADQRLTDALKKAAEEQEVDLVLMGSYGGSPLAKAFIGSAVDFILRESTVPTFVCR